jgi:acyl carrier protein
MQIDIADSAQGVRAQVVEALAEIRVCSVAEIEREMSEGDGNVVLDSIEGVALIAALETTLGRELPGPEDLEPQEYTSINSLTALIERKLGA